MTTRTLLITIPGDILDDRNACGDCPFIAFDWRAGAPEPGRMVCIMPGWEETDIGTGRRHAACLAAERGAPTDRSRLREAHDHIAEHVLPALDRLDAESETKGDSGECVCGHDLLAHDGHHPNRCLGSFVRPCDCAAFKDAEDVP